MEIGRKVQTEIHCVVLGRVPANLLVAQLIKSSVLRETFVTSTAGNRRGVDDVSDLS